MGAVSAALEQRALEPEVVERRQVSRRPVIRSAKLICGPGEGVFDCLVLDQSAAGVLIDMGTMLELPTELTIHFNSGGAFLARKAWAAGTKAGLNLLGSQVLSEETALRMKQAADLLTMQGLLPVVTTLRSARFLDHGELRRVAEDAEAAFMRLQHFLQNPLN
jgi:hypothetical protein